MLSTENLALKPGKVKKLAPKYIGPLKVTKTFANGLAYQLEMPKELGSIHDTFHISLLKRYIPDQFNRNPICRAQNPSKNFMSISELLNSET